MRVPIRRLAILAALVALVSVPTWAVTTVSRITNNNSSPDGKWLIKLDNDTAPLGQMVLYGYTSDNRQLFKSDLSTQGAAQTVTSDCTTLKLEVTPADNPSKPKGNSSLLRLNYAFFYLKAGVRNPSTPLLTVNMTWSEGKIIIDAPSVDTVKVNKDGYGNWDDKTKPFVALTPPK